jgi:hypothetical protein
MRDMKSFNIQLTPVNQAITVAETDPTIPYRFNLSAGQNHACIEFVFDEILECGRFVSEFHCLLNARDAFDKNAVSWQKVRAK